MSDFAVILASTKGNIWCVLLEMVADLTIMHDHLCFSASLVLVRRSYRQLLVVIYAEI